MNSEEKKFVEYIKELTKGQVISGRIKDAIKKAGFERIGHGHHKNAYFNKKYPNWVVKVFNFNKSWSDDVSTIGIIPIELQPHWIKNIYVCKRFVIQPIANEKGGTREDAVKWFEDRFRGQHYERFDIYRNNAFFHDSKPSLVDFSVRIFPRHWYPYKLRKPQLDSILNKKLPRVTLAPEDDKLRDTRYNSVEEMLKDVGVSDELLKQFREEETEIMKQNKESNKKIIVRITRPEKVIVVRCTLMNCVVNWKKFIIVLDGNIQTKGHN